MKARILYQYTLILLFAAITSINAYSQCTVISVSPKSCFFEAEGGSITITATTKNCTGYTVVTPSWIMSSVNGLKVTITALPNTGGLRSGTVSIGSQTVNVSQDQSCLIDPAGSITGSPTVCQGNSYSYSVPANPNAVSYSWSYSGTGATINGTGNSIYISFSSTATYGNLAVVEVNSCGVSSSPSPIYPIVVGSVPNKPTISTNGPTTVCTYDEAILTSSSGQSYKWSNGSTNQSIQALNSGSYSVQVTNSYGCLSPSSDPLTITINPAPNTPSIQVSGATTFCQGSSVTLTAPTESYYIWSNGATSKSITVTNSGTYSVQTKNAYGCVSNPSLNPVSVTVNPVPTFSLTHSTPVCEGKQVTIYGPSGMSYYNWTGNSTGSSKDLVVDAAPLDGYYFLTAKNEFGCSNTANINIESSPLPKFIVSSNSPVCKGDALNLTGPPGMSNYSWSGPSGFSSAEQNPSRPDMMTSMAGRYYLTVTDGNGCSNIANTTATVDIIKTVSASNNGPVCEGSTINLAGSDSLTNYTWTGPNGFLNHLQNPTFTNASIDQTGTYTLTSTNGGCTKSATTQVVVNSATPMVLQGNRIICEGTPLALIGPDGMVSYSWTGPGITGTNTSQNPIVSGNATVNMSGTYTLNAINKYNCSSVATEEIIVKPFDKTPTVGAIAGGFNVSSAGAATYQIPIFTSPGTNGMSPSLSVSYNSQAGNGYLGMGWDLTGLSSISRLPLTIKDDGQVRGVQLNASDKFGLDGNRLVVTNGGTYGDYNTEYHTQAETFVKITSYGTSGSGPRWFKVETKDGRTIEYGNSSTSFLQPPDKDEIMFWYISKITDKFGNYMTYTYHVDRAKGEFWPEKIDYTFNDNKLLPSYNSVNFAWQARPDNTTVYLAGYPIQHNVLLNQVQMISEGTVIREYDFIYTQNSCPQLNEVAEYGKAHTKINSTFVNWIASPEKSTWILTPFTDKYHPYVFLIDDFNGDGKKEVLTSQFGDIYELNNSKTSFVSLGASGLPSILKEFKSGDFNGDGKSDVVVPNTDNVNSFKLYKSNGNSFSLFGNYGPASTEPTELYPGDFNGDGITDVIIRNPANSALTIYWGNAVSPFSNFNSITDITWGTKQYFRDVNGDGKPEIITLDAAGYRIYEWQASSFQLVQSGAQPTDSKDLYFGDLNGDGKQDFIYNSGPSKSTFAIAISTGVNFITYTQTLTGQFDNISVLDVNGDGHDEFSGNNASYAWQGNNLIVAGGAPWYSVLEDFDGDGNADCLFNDGGDGANFEMYPNVNNTIYKKVASIINGLGNTVAISYKTLSNSAVHTPSSDGAYRSIDFAPPSLVVSAVQTNDGKGGLNQIDYHYSGAKFDNWDGQFLGFASVSQTNNTAGLVSTSYSDIDRTYYFSKPVRSEVKTTGGTLLSEATYTTTVRDFGSNRLFIYGSGQTSIDHLHGDATTSSSTVYNDDGNPTSITKNVGGISTSTTTNTFINVGAWCPNKIETTSTTLTRTGETDYTTASNFSYYPNGLLQQQIAEPGNPKQVYTNYTYDDFGNVTQVKVSPDGTTGRVTNFQYETGKFRMVTKRSNALGHYVTYTNDYGLGVVTQSVDNNNLTTAYQYDNFGQLLNTTNTDGTTTAVTTSWVTGSGAPQYALYYASAQTTGKPAVTTYFDALGRQLRSETLGFDGRKLISETGYTPKGQVDYVTLPYYEGDANTDRKSYTYDALGRVLTETAPGLSIAYTYNGLSTTVTNNLTGQSTTKTADASGALVSSSDAGGNISYTYNAMGRVRQVSSPSGSNGMVYDQFGRQTSLTDPNTGTMTYGYNVYGELTSQTDALSNNVSLLYDDIGRVYKRTENSLTTDWTFNTNGRLDNVAASSGISYSYTYDGKGRPTNVKETETNVFKTDFNTSVDYDSNGQISKVTYPSGFAVGYYYLNGYLQEIKRVDDGSYTSIWKLNSVNAKGQVTQTTAGNAMVTTKTYDNRGFIQSIVTNNGSNIIQSLGYSFDAKGYMEWRKDNKRSGLLEQFGYDNLGRLNAITTNGTAKSITYAANGNISAKSDVGTYAYSASHPNAVETLSDNKGVVSSLKQDITYTSFSMPATLAENGTTASFTYGPEHERKIMTCSANGGITKYYSGSYERQLIGSITRELHYITANGEIVAIFEKKTGASDAMHYVHTDHLGSLNVITNASGTIEQEISYDAWGNRRDPATLVNYATMPANLVTDRGFTGHEHMDAFALINMNGRIYDPALGRFLSPDKYVQALDFTQSYNRYSYCMNNPLMFTDPSGYLLNPANLWVYRRCRVFDDATYMRMYGPLDGNTTDYLEESYEAIGGGGGGGYSTSYYYQNGNYFDRKTGKEVGSDIAIGWAIKNTKPGEILFRVAPEDFGKILDWAKRIASANENKGPYAGIQSYLAQFGVNFQLCSGNVYKYQKFEFSNFKLVGEADDNTKLNFDASAFVRGYVAIVTLKDGSWGVEGFAEVIPVNAGNAPDFWGNIRVFNNGREVGFDQLSMKNAITSGLYDPAWTQLGYGRLKLPTNWSVDVQIIIGNTFKRWWTGCTSHILYQNIYNLAK